MKVTGFAVVLGVGLAAAVGCGGEPEAPPVEITPGLQAFVGAQIIDGTGDAPVEDGVLVVRDGRLEAVGAREAVDVPPGAEQIDVTGRTIMPGLINAHGHVNDVRGLEADPSFYTEEHVESQLARYARYGVTTVFSLGGDGPEGIAVRGRQDTPDLNQTRLYVAGPVITAETPEEAVAQVNAVADSDVDIVKIRIDDELGTVRKMTPEVYQAVIDTAHQRGLRLAAHVYYLEDARGVLEAGADLIAHSVRDREVDDNLITLLRDAGVCVCPTLMREVSTYVYESRPDFFDDPFFLRDADPAVIEALSAPAYQEQIKNDRSAQTYKVQLEVAKRNVKTLSDAGIQIAMGTDTGPAARFQGYFEHRELALMVEAGLTPMQAIQAATYEAARCMDVDADLGTLETGKWADFLVLDDNPLDDIANTRSLESVYIAGNPVPGV